MVVFPKFILVVGKCACFSGVLGVGMHADQRKIAINKQHLIAIAVDYLLNNRLGLLAERTLKILKSDNRHWRIDRTKIGVIINRNLHHVFGIIAGSHRQFIGKFSRSRVVKTASLNIFFEIKNGQTKTKTDNKYYGQKYNKENHPPFFVPLGGWRGLHLFRKRVHESK